MTSNQPRRCIFCGGHDLTKEHAIAQWISPLVVPTDKPLWHKVTGNASHSPGQVHRHPTKLLDIQVKQVCGGCNSTWMNSIHHAAKPWMPLMMLGFATVITPEAKRAVAAWAAKVAIMLLCAQRPPLIVHEDYRRWLYTEKEAPPDMAVWLAAYAGTACAQYNTRTLQVARLLLETPEPLICQMEANLVSFSIGHLVVQVWAWSNPREKLPTIPIANDFPDFTIQIWPRDHVEQIWPPRAVFDDVGVWKFFRSSDDTILKKLPDLQR